MDILYNSSFEENNNNYTYYDGLEDYEDCLNGDTMQTFTQFLRCFKYYSYKAGVFSGIVMGISISTALLNMTIILCVIKLKHHKTVFDKIFMGHAIVDFLVGILVIPNYCIYSVFGYWPLGKMFCHLYIR